MTKEYKYTYTFSEQSVDTRYYKVQSDKKLTYDQVLDLGFSCELKDNSVYEDQDGKAVFITTEFGDDSQIEIDEGQENLKDDT